MDGLSKVQDRELEIRKCDSNSVCGGARICGG
jgi:hypothetical protein